jgi:hypothetical protein
MQEDAQCCSGSSCGCHIDIIPTDKKCPECGGRMRLAGRAQLLELRLACQQCDYQSPLLSREELQEAL